MKILKKLLPILTLFFLSSCTENPAENKVLSINDIEEDAAEISIETPFVESLRYTEALNPSDLNVLVPSEFYRIRKIEKNLKERLGFSIKFHYRHFFADSDIVNESKFDAAILMKDTPIFSAIASKNKVGKLASNRLVLAVSPELVQYFGKSPKITGEKINKVATENNIRIQTASPGWDIAAHTAWMSWEYNNQLKNSMRNNVSQLSHGSIRTILDKFTKNEYSAAWIMESLVHKIKENYKNEGQEVPFSFYYIEGKQYFSEYSLYSINDRNRKKTSMLMGALLSGDNLEKLEKLTKLNFINKDKTFSNIYKEYYYKEKGSDSILDEINDYIGSNYPDVHTVYVIPNSKKAFKNDILRKTGNALHSLNKQNMNAFETISSARENDRISILSYDKEIIVHASDIKFTELDKNEITEYLSIPLSKESNSPYLGLSLALLYAAEIKKTHSNVRVKIVHIVTDQYESIDATNQIYADFAEQYKRDIVKNGFLKDVEIFNVGLDGALLENLNGVAGLSRGVHLDGNKIQFKRALLILRNYF